MNNSLCFPPHIERSSRRDVGKPMMESGVTVGARCDRVLDMHSARWRAMRVMLAQLLSFAKVLVFVPSLLGSTHGLYLLLLRATTTTRMRAGARRGGPFPRVCVARSPRRSREQQGCRSGKDRTLLSDRVWKCRLPRTRTAPGLKKLKIDPKCIMRTTV